MNETKQGENSPEVTAAAGAAVGEDMKAGGDVSSTGNHPNPAREASDTAEATAEAAKKADQNTRKVPETPAGAAAKVLDAALAGAYLKTEGSESAAANKPATAQSTKENLLAKLVRDEYAKRYPDNKTFYITSDKQVFLEKNKEDAGNHQRGLKGGRITTVNVD